MRIGRIITLAVLSAPLILILAGAVKMAMMSPGDWSGDTIGASNLPIWVASFSPFLVAAAAFAMVAVTFAKLLYNTRAKYHFGPLALPFGMFMMYAGALMLFGLSSADAYLFFGYGSIFDGGTNAFGSLFMTLLLMGCGGGVFCMAAYIYTQGVISDGSGRHDKRKGEVDATGVLLQELDAEKAATQR
jgi:hypothetical protein